MHKLQFNINFFYFIFLLTSVAVFTTGNAQEIKVITSRKAYAKLVKKDSLQQMIEIKNRIPGSVYDLRYATADNFTGRQLYPSGKATYLRVEALTALQKVSEELLPKNYGIKIWDAYRPYAVTKKMWNLIGDERYVANPAKGSGHNRGLAVDLTLIDLATGAEIPMGTSFDNFTDSAHHDFKALPETILKNRALLRSSMEKAGFKALETEWWHYSFPNDHSYEVLDLSFKQLAKYR